MCSRPAGFRSFRRPAVFRSFRSSDTERPLRPPSCDGSLRLSAVDRSRTLCGLTLASKTHPSSRQCLARSQVRIDLRPDRRFRQKVEGMPAHPSMVAFLYDSSQRSLRVQREVRVSRLRSSSAGKSCTLACRKARDAALSDLRWHEDYRELSRCSTAAALMVKLNIMNRSRTTSNTIERHPERSSRTERSPLLLTIVSTVV